MILKKTVFFLLLFVVAATDINGQNEVTKADVITCAQKYEKYVLKKQGQINFWYEKLIFKGAKNKGYDDFSISLIPASYNFFKCKKGKLKKTLNNVCEGNKKDLKYINNVISIFDGKEKKDKNVLNKILHEQHVNSLTLSKNINKSLLMENPKEFKKLINQGKVKLEEYYHFVALNLLITYLLELKNSI